MGEWQHDIDDGFHYEAGAVTVEDARGDFRGKAAEGAGDLNHIHGVIRGVSAVKVRFSASYFPGTAVIKL